MNTFILTNFVSSDLKLHNRYCHTLHLSNSLSNIAKRLFSQSIFLSAKLHKVDLFIRPGTWKETCGGYNVYIEIKEINGTKSCKTKEDPSFSANDHIVWENERLGTCKEMDFDTNLSEINFEIKTKNTDDDFCPGKLTFEMKNGVLFIKDNIEEWNVHHEGIAPKKV